MSEQLKETIIRSALTGAVIGAFLFAGLAMFAGKVFSDHAAMVDQLADMRRDIGLEMKVLQVKQIETNARVIEMRRCTK